MASATRYISDDEKTAVDENGLQPTASVQRGSFIKKSIAQHDKHEGYEYEDPFGDEEGADTQYRTMTWFQGSTIMIAETISLGILSLPSVLDRVGLAAGVILIVGLGIIATYTGFVIGQFKNAYPYVHTFADAGEVMFTPIGLPRFGKEFFGAAQFIFWIFTMGSHLLTFTIMLSTLTDGATCTIVWSVIGLIVFFLFNIPRTLKSVSYFSIASFISIFAAVLILMIALGVDPIANRGPVQAFKRNITFVEAFNAVTNIIFAYAGHLSFFNFISELKHPQDFPKALYLLQIADIGMYVIVAIVVYIYAGDQVTSPAFGSAKEVVKKVCWGIAIPTIVIAGVIYGHVATKYIYVRIFRGTKHMSERSFLSIGTWLGLSLITWTIAWIISESIPVFNDLLALISALFASWFTYGLAGIMWLFLNSHQLFSSPRKIFLTVVNISITLMGAAIFGIGLWTSGTAIQRDSSAKKGGSWSCANNGQ